jgi:hypothetical protein
LLDHLRGAADVEAGEIEIAARRGVGVLHVDDDDGGLVDRDPDRLRPRRQGHQPLLRLDCRLDRQLPLLSAANVDQKWRRGKTLVPSLERRGA